MAAPILLESFKPKSTTFPVVIPDILARGGVACSPAFSGTPSPSITTAPEPVAVQVVEEALWFP